VLNLILALQNLLNACWLLSPNGCRSLLSDLLRYISLIDLNEFDIKSVTYLLKEVVNNALVPRIWNIIKDLVVKSTPPLRLLLNLD
jgi:hypothetical protein